ncbi:MAG: hypothetical protein O2816_16995 [Planctomycetota bacterium]|nr:hypothetical protein [Planctomycetota bacterium]
MQTPSPALFLVLGLGALTACAPSSKDSSSGGGGGSSATISFVSIGSVTVEDTTQVGAQIVLSDVLEEDVDINFFTNGTAFEFGDYVVTTPPPVTIPAGSTSTLVTLQIFEDGVGELDEQVTVTLVTPANAGLGTFTQHQVTILDDDETPFTEVEPNDILAQANMLPGPVGEGLSWEISGAGLSGNFDIFECNVSADPNIGSCTMFFTMTPSSGITEVVINVLDENGNTIATYDDDVGGTAVLGTLNVVPSQKFYLAVTVEVAGSNYTLDVVGV